MATDIQLCNFALGRTGTSARITTLADTGATKKESEACALLYPIVLDAVLESYDWGFASRFETLTVYGTQDGTPPSPTNWAFSYLTPADCIKAREIVLPGMRVMPKEFLIPFDVASEVVTSAGTMLIYTDQEDAELRYTARITETGLFTPLFAAAFVGALAIELNIVLSLKADDNKLRNLFQIDMERAKCSNAGERRPDLPPDGDMIRAFQ